MPRVSGLITAASLALLIGSPVQSVAAEAAVDIRSRAARPGDHYRFVAESLTDVTGSRAFRQTNRVTFDVEVVAVTGESITFRSRWLEATVEDARPSTQVWARSWIGVPIAFEATFDYEPRRILNWPEAKSLFLTAVDHDPDAAPGDRDAIRTMLAEAEASGDEALITELLGGFRTLAKPRMVPIMVGRQVIPEDRFLLGGAAYTGKTLLEAGAPDPIRCQVSFSRTSAVATGEAAADTRFERALSGKVSTYDGWPLALMEREITSKPDRRVEQRITITRQGGAPGCGPRR